MTSTNMIENCDDSNGNNQRVEVTDEAQELFLSSFEGGSSIRQGDGMEHHRLEISSEDKSINNIEIIVCVCAPSISVGTCCH